MAMNAKEQRKLNDLQRKAELLQEQLDKALSAYREMLYEKVDLQIEVERLKEQARGMLGGEE